ncbi:MAG: F0F1 ATP synthase subunit delta [Pseudomonadota bacterium]
MADNNTIARPYAQALFELANENGALDVVSRSLDVAKDLLSDGQVGAFLSRPALTDAQRLEFLQSLFAKAAGSDSAFAGSKGHGTNFLKLLLENGRVGVLPEIAEQFATLKAQAENTLDVIVTSATEIDTQQQNEISRALKARLGREINLETRIDKSLIGGAVISAGDVVIDGSLRGRLEGLTNALIN